MMKKTVRIGVIGYGYWGPNLVRNLVDIPTCSLVAVADLNTDRLERLQACYQHIFVTDDYQRLFALGLDAVVIATPPPTHFDIASDALLNGLHVLVEKPLALSSLHARALVDLARRRNHVLMVGHTYIYNSAVSTLKKMIQSADLGAVHYVDTARLSLGLFQRDLNVVWDLAPHDISIIMDLLGAAPTRVWARGTACVQENIEDVAYVTLEFPNNILAHVHVSWLDPNKVRRITVVGSKKMVVYDDMEASEKLRVYDKGVECSTCPGGYHEYQFAYRYGDITIPHIKFPEPLHVECQHFVDCVSGNVRPQTDGQTGLEVVKVIEAAQRSLRNAGHAEEIDMDDPVGVTDFGSQQAVGRRVWTAA